jgi:hypothetical protein
MCTAQRVQKDILQAVVLEADSEARLCFSVDSYSCVIPSMCNSTAPMLLPVANEPSSKVRIIAVRYGYYLFATAIL